MNEKKFYFLALIISFLFIITIIVLSFFDSDQKKLFSPNFTNKNEKIIEPLTQEEILEDELITSQKKTQYDDIIKEGKYEENSIETGLPVAPLMTSILSSQNHNVTGNVFILRQENEYYLRFEKLFLPETTLSLSLSSEKTLENPIVISKKLEKEETQNFKLESLPDFTLYSYLLITDENSNVIALASLNPFPEFEE